MNNFIIIYSNRRGPTMVRYHVRNANCLTRFTPPPSHRKCRLQLLDCTPLNVSIVQNCIGCELLCLLHSTWLGFTIPLQWIIYSGCDTGKDIGKQSTVRKQIMKISSKCLFFSSRTFSKEWKFGRTPLDLNGWLGAYVSQVPCNRGYILATIFAYFQVAAGLSSLPCTMRLRGP